MTTTTTRISNQSEIGMEMAGLNCPIYSESDIFFLDKFAFWVEGILLVVLAVLGVLGNTFASIIISRKEMRNSFNLLLVSLACFDSAFLLGSILESFRKTFHMESELHIILFPNFLYPFNQMAISGSIFMTVAIAWERYIAVHYPLDYNQAMNDTNAMRKRLIKYVGPVFLLAVTFNIVKFFEANVVYRPVYDNMTNHITYHVELEVAELRTHPIYSAYNNWSRLLVLGILPFLLLVFFNTKIYNDILERRKRRLRINRLGRPTDSNVMTEFVSLPPISSSQRRRSSLSLDHRHLEMARRNNYREHHHHQTHDSLPCKNNNDCPHSLSSGWRGRSHLKSWKRSLSASARRCCSPRMDSITSKTSTNDYEQDEEMTNAMGMSVRKENGHISISCVGDGVLQTNRTGSSTRPKTLPSKSHEQREIKGQLDRPLSRDQSVHSRCSATSEVITTNDVIYLRRSGMGSRRGIQNQNQSPSSSMSRPTGLHPHPPPPPPPSLLLANRTLETSFGCSTSLSSTTTSNLSPVTQEDHAEDNEEERASLLSNSETGLPRLMNSHLRPSCSIRSNNKFQLLNLPPELSCLMPENSQFSRSNSLCSSGTSVTTLNNSQLQPPLIVPSLAASASALLLSSTNPVHHLQNHHDHPPRHHQQHHHQQQQQQQQQLQEPPSSQANTVLRSNVAENVVNHHLNHRLHRRRVQNINERRRRFEDNLAAIFMGFVLVFLVCHFPRLLLNIHELITIREAMECTNLGEHGFSLWSMILISISHFLLVLNSSTNILIYCLLSSKFREECSVLFRKISRRVPTRPANVLM